MRRMHVLHLAIACVAFGVGLAGCGSKPPAPEVAAAPMPSRSVETSVVAPAGPAKLAPAKPSRTWAEFKLQAAQRMVSANPSGTYTGAPQQMLLAIPVLEIELNADGSVKNIEVLRKPSQALETIQLAIDAVKRAAPFGDVSKLPKPWRFSEVFLFNDDKRFKPRTLDAL